MTKLSQSRGSRCHNVVARSKIRDVLGHLITDYSDFYPVVEKSESYKSAKVALNTCRLSLKEGCVYS